MTLNHLIASHAANYNWPFGTLPVGLFWSNLDMKDLETHPITYSGGWVCGWLGRSMGGIGSND